MTSHQNRLQTTFIKYRTCYTVLILLLTSIGSGCQQIQKVISADQPMRHEMCHNEKRVLKLGFYAYFAPVSYSAEADPTSNKFNTHRGYEADLLTALETMEALDVSFSRRAIAEWPSIWLKAADPEYDIISGGITILESRTRDATGTPVVAFTSGHIEFRQSLLVRAEDAERLSNYATLTRDVRVGVLSGTTGEARLLEITGIVDAKGVLVEGTHIETDQGTLIADGTQDYTITAARTSVNLAGRKHLYPPSENMPQVIYLGDEVGESELLGALAEGNIDAIARGEIGNQDAAYADGAFVVTALDDQIEYGGFTLAVEDVKLITCIDKGLDYLTDGGNIGYGEWLQDPRVFITRAEMWNAGER